ncbi:3-keto-disaccharide hydrolase [Ohtaekwangia sp.]|uniref:3-keto-disaccharide hydrolase n=1 Tax=Ohtaekwangia sp. TaxID=2066019 RepID=UPI002FDD6AFC
MKLPFTFLFMLFCSIAFSQSINLFNGKDLTGWQVYGTEKWYVEKGELICESGPDKQYGYLATNNTYKNFELTVEFKQESNGNSGVFFHCSIEGTKISGWQAEVAPIGKHTGGIYESYGRGWLMQPGAEKENYLKEGEWNRMIVRVEDNLVTTFLNGHPMITLTDEKIGASTGKIALQIHDGGGVKVRWRVIQLKQL